MGRALPPEHWSTIDAQYRGEAGHGHWERHRPLPDRWPIDYAGLTLVVKLAPFKHTGVFPEQAEHWRWLSDTAAGAGRRLTVLNLFAYTGAATITLAKAGHLVTHVDASKPTLAWARENAAANALPADAIRWIQDDAATFVRRELRRGKHYDAAILDPPAFGRTPDGHTWRLREHLPALLTDIVRLLPSPVFLLVNDYSRTADHAELASLLKSTLGDLSRAGRVEAGHTLLPLPGGRTLDTGCYARWHSARR
jgi:23S rRNA (cytosine1962-C5)-methyltransferase